MMIVWPLHKRHYLTADDNWPYVSSAQRMIDYGISCGYATDETSEIGPRIYMREERVFGWQLTANALTEHWETVREIADRLQVKDLAILAHELKSAVSHGLLQRKQVPYVHPRGFITQRWSYRVVSLGWQRAS